MKSPIRDTNEETEVVRLGHGAGGRMSAELVGGLMRDRFSLGEMDDAAVFDVGSTTCAFTTDSFVVSPLFFPGGDIGRLAVFGTVNDLAVQGAIPKWLSLSIVTAEGFPLEQLRLVIESVSAAAGEADVAIVTGDTKVVERGGIDGLVLNTAGVGVVRSQANLSCKRVTPGDKVIVSGPVGAHEVAVVSRRYDLGFEMIESDCAAIAGPVGALVKKLGSDVKWMRDPTRGGLATVLNELCRERRAEIEVIETAVPLDEDVRTAAEILGLDPLYMACEGRFVAVIDPERAGEALRTLRDEDGCEAASIIGTVEGVDSNVRAVLRTEFGSRRILRYLASDQQPRIC